MTEWGLLLTSGVLVTLLYFLRFPNCGKGDDDTSLRNERDMAKRVIWTWRVAVVVCPAIIAVRAREALEAYHADQPQLAAIVLLTMIALPIVFLSCALKWGSGYTQDQALGLVRYAIGVNSLLYTVVPYAIAFALGADQGGWRDTLLDLNLFKIFSFPL